MILLSFDIEEFDMPFEYNRAISLEEQISISTEGTLIILDLLKKNKLKATFFCTVIFAQNAEALIRRIITDGHELASHGYYHSAFKDEHLLQSRLALEQLSGTKVNGYRMARMMPVDEKEIQKAGYLYNSSINPTWLPGRYNNRHISRTWFSIALPLLHDTVSAESQNHNRPPLHVPGRPRQGMGSLIKAEPAARTSVPKSAAATLATSPNRQDGWQRPPAEPS